MAVSIDSHPALEPFQQLCVVAPDCVETMLLPQPLLSPGGSFPRFFRVMKHLQEQFGRMIGIRIRPHSAFRQWIFSWLHRHHRVVAE